MRQLASILRQRIAAPLPFLALIPVVALSTACEPSATEVAVGDELSDVASLTPSSLATNLPIVAISTQDQAVGYREIQSRGKELETESTLALLPPSLGERNPSDLYPAPMPGVVKIRGNTSARNEKNSFTFKIKRDGSKNEALLDIGKGDKWVLYAPYIDKTFMRNTMAFEISRKLGLIASRTRYVEVFVNDEYLGIYALMQKIGNDMDCKDFEADDGFVGDAGDGGCFPDRPKAEDGGYIISRDGKPDELEECVGDLCVDGFQAGQSGIHFTFEEPNLGDLEDGDVEADVFADIQSRVAAIEEALCGGDEATIDGVLDVEAFANYFVARELFNDLDGFRRSMYFYFNDAGQLSPGPMWDFDSGSGTQMLPGFLGLRKWQFPETGWALSFFILADWVDKIINPSPGIVWIEELLKHDWFVDRVRTRWESARYDLLGLEESGAACECDGLLTPNNPSPCDSAKSSPLLEDTIDQHAEQLLYGCGDGTLAGQVLTLVDEGVYDESGELHDFLRIARPTLKWVAAMDQAIRESTAPQHIDSLEWSCPVFRNYSRWEEEQLGQESDLQGSEDSGHRFWDEGPAYFSRRARETCSREFRRVDEDKIYRSSYWHMTNDFRNWMNDRVEWLDSRMPELGADFASTGSYCE